MSKINLYVISSISLVLSLISFIIFTHSVIIFSTLFFVVGVVIILYNKPLINSKLYYVLCIVLLLLMAKGSPDYQTSLNGDFIIYDYLIFPASLITPISTLLISWITLVNGLSKIKNL